MNIHSDFVAHINGEAQSWELYHSAMYIYKFNISTQHFIDVNAVAHRIAFRAIISSNQQ